MQILGRSEKFKFQLKFLIYLITHSSTAGLNSASDTPETSSEILDDVLKQLDKLSPEKRKKVLDRLNAANLIALKTQTKQISPSTTETQKISTEGSQDEVEILDMHEPKMGSYKKKRSKLNLLKIY